MDGVGAIATAVPPVAELYQLKLAPLEPVASNWTGVAPWQYVIVLPLIPVFPEIFGIAGFKPTLNCW